MEISTLEQLVSVLGEDVVLNELQQWLPSDKLNEFIEDTCKLYDIDYIED